MKSRFIFVLLSIFCASSFVELAAENQTTRKERNFILDANKAFNNKEYGKAIKLYNEALEENPTSERAKYNLAVTMLKIADEKGGAGGNNSAMPDSISMKIMNQADSIFRELYATSPDNLIKELSIYNSGNIMFNENQYAISIDQYKKALRLNPNNNNARHNLRLAQLKLQQQENQNEDKEVKKDKEDEKNEQEKQQPQPQEQPQPQPQPQQQQPKQSNAETILNAAQQNEDKTRERLEKQQQQQIQRYHEKPW